MTPPRRSSRSKTVTRQRLSRMNGTLGWVDFDEDHVARQRAAVLPQQRHQRGRAIVGAAQRIGRHQQRVALEQIGRAAVEVDHLRDRHRRFRRIGGEGRLAAPAPCRHDEKDRAADGQRHEAAFEELERTGDEEGGVDRGERPPHQGRARRAPSPAVAGDGEHRQRGDQHDAGDREAVGRRERRRRAESDDQRDAAQIQRPIDERDVDLAGMGAIGVLDGDARQQADADRLREQREGAGDQRLRGDDGGDRGEQGQRIDRRRRRHAVEQGAVDHRRAAEEIGALPEIVGDEGGKDDREPRDADRPRAEMAEVGVHRLAPGHHQHQRAEDQQRLAKPGLAEERQAEPRVERPQDLRLADDLRQAEDGDDDEPDDQDRPEDDADARGALELDGEQPGQQRDRDRYDIGGEGGRGDVEPLDRRQHADRRRDHAVAEQQAGPQHQPP